MQGALKKAWNAIKCMDLEREETRKLSETKGVVIDFTINQKLAHYSLACNAKYNISSML